MRLLKWKMFTCSFKVSRLWFIRKFVYKQFHVSMLEIMPIGLRMAFINPCPKNDQYSKGEWNQQIWRKQLQQYLSINICSLKDIFLHLIWWVHSQDLCPFMHISYMQGRAQAYLKSDLNPFNDTTFNQRHHLDCIVCRTFLFEFHGYKKFMTSSRKWIYNYNSCNHS